MDTELNIVVNAVDDTSEALGAISEELAAVGESATAMATTMEESGTAVNESVGSMTMTAEESYAELTAAMEAFDAQTTTMASEFDLAMTEMATTMTAADEEIIAELDALLAAELGASTGFGASMASIKSSAMQAGIVVGIAFLGLKTEITDAVGDSAKWNTTITNLNVALKDTGSSIPTSQITEYAAKLSSITLYSEQDILTAEALVMNHKELQSSYQGLTASAADLAQKTGDTLPQAMGILVKVLNDPITGMRQLQTAGIDFNAQMVTTVNDLARGGATAQASAIIMGALKDQIDGMARAAATAGGTGMTKLMNELQVMNTIIGEDLGPVLDNLAKQIEPIVAGIAKWAEAHPKLTAAILIASAAFAGMVVVLVGLGLVIGAIGTAFTAMGALIAAVAEAPIALITAAFVAVGVGVGVLYVQIKNNWEAIKTTIESVANEVLSFIQDWYNKIMGWIDRMINGIKNVAGSVGGGISNFVGGIGNFITTHLAEGGIVTQPTYALVGEAGPEAVIPLSAFANGSSLAGAGGGTSSGAINVYITGSVWSTADQATTLGNMIAKQINRQLKLQSFR